MSDPLSTTMISALVRMHRSGERYPRGIGKRTADALFVRGLTECGAAHDVLTKRGRRVVDRFLAPEPRAR